MASTDKFNKVLSGTTRPVATTLSAQKLDGATSFSVVATTGWETSTPVHGIMYRTDAQGNKVAGSQIDWKGDVSGTTVSNVVVTAGDDDTYDIGDTVELAPTAAWGDDIATGILVEHNQDGTHSDVTAETLAVSGATTLTGALTVKSYDGWINTADTWTYASATTFTIAGVDRTAQFPVGTKIKLTQTTAKYFYVTASSFSTDTTITVTGGSDYSLANAAITSPALSYDATPQGFPQYFNYTPTWTNLTVGNGTLNASRFSMSGKTVSMYVKFTLGGTSSIGGNVFISLPVTAATSLSVDIPVGVVRFQDAGTAAYTGRIEIETSTTAQLVCEGAGGSFVQTSALNSTTPFTWVSTDFITLSLTYEAA
jgi:hypothetical protein